MSTVPSGLGGVPTHRKTTSASRTAALTLSVNCSWPEAKFSCISSCSPGSKMWQWPSCSVFSFRGSFSTPRTVCPMLARHVPVTRPTYPHPMIVTSMTRALRCENPARGRPLGKARRPSSLPLVDRSDRPATCGGGPGGHGGTAAERIDRRRSRSPSDRPAGARKPIRPVTIPYAGRTPRDRHGRIFLPAFSLTGRRPVPGPLRAGPSNATVARPRPCPPPRSRRRATTRPAPARRPAPTAAGTPRRRPAPLPTAARRRCGRATG